MYITNNYATSKRGLYVCESASAVLLLLLLLCTLCEFDVRVRDVPQHTHTLRSVHTPHTDDDRSLNVNVNPPKPLYPHHTNAEYSARAMHA